MNGNIDNPQALVFVPIAAAQYAFPSGNGTGWVDTDCSAQLGTDTKKIYLFDCFTVPNGNNPTVACRPHGSSIDTSLGAYSGTGFFCTVDANGHIDFKNDNATTLYYRTTGYLVING